MNGAIGDTLPFALAIAVSPIPIIAAILMLVSPGAQSKALGFLGGWVLGITGVTIIFTLLSSVLGASDKGASPVVGVIKIVLGAAMVLLGIRQWRKRPRGDE